MEIVILGLSITSSWHNDHARTYRSLVRELVKRGHKVTFLEQNTPCYASNRDLPHPPSGKTILYQNLDDLRDRFENLVGDADLVIIGSHVPEGSKVGSWAIELAPDVIAFYDIDTPITLARLEHGDCGYLSPELIPRYDLYLSVSGGPALDQLAGKYGSPMVRPFYCSVDPNCYFPDPLELDIDLGYMGTYSLDPQSTLEQLLLEPARKWPDGRFEVAGSQYPQTIDWPSNVTRIEHLPPSRHRTFYNRQRFTLDITRADMIGPGYSPSMRLLEAAACGTPVISNWWTGLETFFEPETEVLISRSANETLHYLRDLSPDEIRGIGNQARAKVIRFHTAAHRAEELEAYTMEARANWRKSRVSRGGLNLVGDIGSENQTSIKPIISHEDQGGVIGSS